MSSDGYFEDDIDPSLLNELDAIEAAHFSPSRDLPKTPPLIKVDTSDFFDDTFDVDESELQRLDTFIEDVYQGRTAPVAGPSTNIGATSRGKLQTTLFGDILPSETSSNKGRATAGSSRTGQMQRSTSKKNPFGQQAPKTKTWDRTAFARSGWKKSAKTAKWKGKEKARASFDDGDDEEGEEEVEFEQFPAPFVSIGPPPPMKLVPDLLEAKHWIYPLNQPKRDYQFNIVKHSLFENTLVALPTGLGKTFVAGVVMLNFYRWFPEGKVIFVAPTKPLVAQQIDACHKTCGIPGQDAAELTGEIPKPTRAKLWQGKRIFYMTPQTLVNDLVSGICDPQEVILIVVDEAHKATGDYAYSQVIRFMMAKNPHFRVLALSATPGGDPEKVQNIIDHLHISRIEIRDEASMDLREYMFTKEIKQYVIAMNDDINKVKDLLAKIMENILKGLVNAGIFEPLNVVKLHPFRAQMKAQELGKTKRFPWAFVPLSKLGHLARAMGYLMEASLKMCYTYLKGIVEGADEETGKKSNKTVQTQLKNDSTFQALLREIAGQQNSKGGFRPHPKMEQLKMLLIQHFGGRLSDGEGGDGANEGNTQETRAMVFVTNRGCVDEIEEILNEERPLIRATRFIGQGTDKQGKKGFAQKEQLDVIQKFKDGHFNVLVSTSIGEEGLDIGEVDMIICYDAQKAPIRMLQRIGRTGRKRAGYVHVLLSEIREEANWDKAKDTYGEVQKSIVRGDQLELYGDVERLLPAHVKPECLERKMDIEQYVREEKGKKVAVGANAPAKKRKRDGDGMGMSIPTGASSGFVKASELKRKKPKLKEFDPLAGEDDDTDREIEAGLHGPRRTVSTSATPSESRKKTLRKATTMDGRKKSSKEKKEKKKKSPKPRQVEPLTVSQFWRKGLDDSDDMEIEKGIDLIPKTSRGRSESSSSPSLSPVPERSKSPKYWTSSPDIVFLDDNVAAKPPVNPRGGTFRSPARAKPSSSSSLRRSKSPKYWTSSPDMQIVDDVIDISSSHPSRSNSPAPQSHGSRSRVERSPSSKSASPLREVSGIENKSIAWLLSDDDDPDIQIVDSSPISRTSFTHSPPNRSGTDFKAKHFQVRCSANNSRVSHKPEPDDSVIVVEEDSSDILPSKPATTSSPSIPLRFSGNSKPKKLVKNVAMPPPDLPVRLTIPSPISTSDQEYPEPSFSVRAIGRRPTKRIVTPREPESPLLDMPPPSQRRLQRKRSPAPAPRPSKRKPLPNEPSKHNPWIDVEAVHSGNEMSEGSSQFDEVETEFDRQFLQGLPESQVSPSYDQTLAYRQSLFTQAPAIGKAPVFANRPATRGARFSSRLGSRPRPLLSSSPPIDDEEPNDYAMGSFVVDDDAEITYASSES